MNIAPPEPWPMQGLQQTLLGFDLFSVKLLHRNVWSSSAYTNLLSFVSEDLNNLYNSQKNIFR